MSNANQSTSKPKDHLYKILVIGDLGTGKTSIIKRYVHRFFTQHYKATIGVDFALKVLNWDENTLIRLQLWDIAGQERYGNMTRVYYKEAVGAFIVFDVTRKQTFDSVANWKTDLDSKVQLPDGSNIPCVLLANKVPNTVESWENVMRDYETLWNFPNVCGAMDGKHVTIRCPPKTGSQYFNYKKDFSTILFAIVDANYNFIYIDVGTNGRVNDAAVFAKSTFNEALQNNSLNIPEQGIFVADDAFPLRTNILKPYSRCGQLTEKQKIFNYRLSRARRVVENTFGILVSKFRIFEKPIPLSIQTTEQVVKTTCALHNWLRKTSTPTHPYIPRDMLDIENWEEGRVEPGTATQHPHSGLEEITHGASNNYSRAAGEYLSDEVFTTPNLRHAELTSMRSPVYVYEFAYKGQIGGLANLPAIQGADNVAHTEELHYLFGGREGLADDLNNYQKDDQVTMKQMLTLWTNFIKYQNPTPTADPLLENITWPRVTSGLFQYLKINQSLAVFESPKYYDKVKKTFDDLVVELPQGKIRGHILENGIGKNFLAFQEIPYAAPPTGKNRFKEPKDPEKWPGILNTTKNSKICIQNFYRPENLESTEDCLYLNVYVSGEIRQEPLLPVLFYIHGGGFTTESGAIEYYNPKYLMDQEIIVVSPNYRLGIFGFLTTSDGVIPGNLGLKDQFLALKWVHKYIHLFGGDKNRITVVGHSAGAVCASFIQQSPLSRGLVKSYIILSGTSLSPYTYQSKPDYYAFKLGRALDKNFTSNSSSDLLKLLYRFSAQEIIDAVVIDDIFNRTLSPSIIWIPTIESPTYENAFLTTPMLEAFTKGDFQKVPLLMGTTSSEGLGLMPSMDKLIPEARKYDRNISMLLHPRLKISEDSLEEASRLYKSVYTSTPFEEDINAFIKCLGDDLFSTPLFHHAMLASKYSPVYFLQFSYKGPMGAGDANYSDVGHAEDIHYVFTGISGFKNSPEIYSESDQLTMRRMLAILTNFVKYQNPTPEKNDLFEEIVWPPMRGDNIQYMNFNRTLTINKGLLLHYREVKQIFDKYAKRSYTFF